MSLVKNLRKISRQISFFSLNIRSLPNKFAEFQNMLQSLNKDNFKFTVLALNEIWNVPKNISFDIPGYSPLHYNIRDKTGQNSKAGGGVGLWVDSNFSFEPIKEISIFEPHVFESQFIKLKTSETKFAIVGNIYRPNTAPFASIKKFNDHLENILNFIKSNPELKKCQSIEILGDMNLDLINYRNHFESARYVEIIMNFSLLPLITLPTRIAHSSATLIDHILSSQKSDNYISGIIESLISDHMPTFYIKPLEIIKNNQKTVRSRVFSSSSIIKFKDNLKEHDWTQILSENDPSLAYNIFFNALEEKIDMCFPERNIKISNNKNIINNPWFTQGLLLSKKRKFKLESIKLKNPSLENVAKFKNYNLIYTKLVRTAKFKYYENKFIEFSKNSRKTWDTIREVLSKQKKKVDLPDYFKVNGTIFTEQTDICEEFNNFFCRNWPKISQVNSRLTRII